MTWADELRAAGWHEVRLHVWQSPTGALFRGPYGAWTVMDALRRWQAGSVPETVIEPRPALDAEAPST